MHESAADIAELEEIERLQAENEQLKNKILKKDMELDYFRREKSWLTNQLIKAKEAAN